MQFSELLETIETMVEDYLSALPEVTADKLGLDKRAGKVWIDVKEDVIIAGDEGRLNYYGGFEYVDEDCTHSLCGYKVYTSESDRVADAIDFYKANKEND